MNAGAATDHTDRYHAHFTQIPYFHQVFHLSYHSTCRKTIFKPLK